MEEKDLDKIYRQLQLTNSLLLIIATDKDFSNHTQERQLALLGERGFRNKELSDLFGIKPQQVNNAFRKAKIKRS